MKIFGKLREFKILNFVLKRKVSALTNQFKLNIELISIHETKIEAYEEATKQSLDIIKGLMKENIRLNGLMSDVNKLL
ncbi:hypothetical protein LCGC14_1094510 [marine sediment metagenome]|uniref:Uncharacterized protein n=1 Tax=marine sediment metagenome TaxID=412755 RepID=A0A0F9MZ45_9ZZZZ